MIRGEQMADYLGCKLNPKRGFESDVCIHVKPPDFSKVKDGDWVDILDGRGLLRHLKDRPNVNAIAFSQYTYNEYQEVVKNKMVLIPQHHCNFDRELRPQRDIRTVGFIGGELGFYQADEIKRGVEDEGVKTLFFFFFTII